MSRIKKPKNRINLLDKLVNDGIPVKYLNKILYIVFLYTLFIFYNHFADRNVAKKKLLENEVDNLKAEYKTIHSDFRNDRLQSSLVKILKNHGIYENNTPPMKIKVKK